MQDFAGLVAAVTGGASGIGAATADLLAERGATVVVLDMDRGAGQHHVVLCDITRQTEVADAVDAIERDFGGIDVLINNAGIGAAGTVADFHEAEWLRVLNVNVLGAARMTAAALPHLRRSLHAAIVNTGSIVASVGVPQRVLYSASKGAVSSMTLAMAADHVRESIRVNAVLPGTADTPWIERLMKDAADPGAAAAALRSRQPLARLVTAAEVARAIAYLASPLSGSTTGTLLVVDGGMGSLRLPT